MARTRSSPSSSPVEMLAPDLEKPGRSRARTWLPPMRSESVRPMSSRAGPRAARRSASHMYAEPSTSDRATTHRDARGPSISGLASTPTTASGTVAATIHQASRNSSVLRVGAWNRPGGPPR